MVEAAGDDASQSCENRSPCDCVAHDGLWGEHREDPAQDDHERKEQRSRNGEIWGMYSAALPNRLTECAM